MNIDIILKQAISAFGEHRFGETEEHLRKVLQDDPSNPTATYYRGLIAGMEGRGAEAVEKIRKALSLGLKDQAAHFFLGVLYHQQRKYDDAIASYRWVLERDPNHIDAINNLADIEYKFGRVSQSEAYCRRALEVKRDFFKAYNNLGNALRDQGRLAEARESYCEATRLREDFSPAFSNTLLCRCYDSEVDFAQLCEEHRQFGRRFAVKPVNRPPVDRTPDRTLRIGFVSPDFRTHSVAYFVEPILEHLDRDLFEIHCYSDVPCPDPVTLRLKKMADVWHEAWRTTDDAELARLIAQDRIDILVDLAGHSAGNRLVAFAYKPAPILVTHIGYPATTGLSAMDYRITDAWADGPEEDRYYIEKLFRLEPGFLCYRPPREAPAVGEKSPGEENGYITFGSFNNLPKIGPLVIERWALILKAVPGSKLMLKTKPLVDVEVKKRLESLFAQHGIGAERLILRGHSPSLAEHLARYRDIDIALDPFPYNGTTTSCEALWMGVPVVALEGSHHPGRVSHSILARAGLGHLVAPSLEKYEALASFLAQDGARLTALRKGLRAALANSPLCDGAGYAAALGRVYRAMWERFLAQSA